MPTIRARRLLACLLLAATPLPAQDTPATPAAQDPATTVAAIQARIDALRADEATAPDLKTSLLGLYGRALEAAKTATANAAATENFRARTSEAPTSLAAARGDLEAVRQPEAPVAGATLQDLEQGLKQKQQNQTSANRDATALEAESRRRAERRQGLPQVLDDLRHQLDALPEQVPEAADVDPRLQAARRMLRQSERLALRNQIEATTAEQQAYEAEDELLRVRRDLAARLGATAKAEVDAWQEALQNARARSAQTAASAAEAKAEQVDPRLQGLASENARLAASLKSVADRLASAELEKTAAADELRSLEEETEDMRERARLVGSTDEFGALLRQRRASLNSQLRSFLQRSRHRDQGITDVQLKKLEFDDRLRRIVRLLPAAWLQEELGSGVTLEELPEATRAEAESLRKTRKDLLTRLSNDYDKLVSELTAQASNTRTFVSTVDEYRAFLTERVLGIRSSPPLWQLDSEATAAAGAWLVDATQWQRLVDSVFSDSARHVWPLALLALMLALLLLRPWLRRRLAHHGELAARGSNVTYRHTALALVDSLLLAGTGPALLLLLAWRMTTADDSEFTKAIAGGCEAAAAPLLTLGLVRTLAYPKGLGESHFRWRGATLKLLRKNLRLLLPCAVPAAFVLGALEARGDEALLGSLGSLLQVAIFGVLLVVSWRVMHPTTGLIGGPVAGKPTTGQRFRRVWFVLAVLSFSTLLVMAAAGYDYTSMQLARRLLLTLSLVVLGLLVNALVVRELVLERRRLQIRQAQERLAALRAAAGDAATPETLQLEDIDPQSLARQTQALVRGAITIVVLVLAFNIWADLLPALQALRRVELWPVEEVSGTVWITLADVLLSLFVVVAAVVASRSVPALLELLVLQRLRMQAGERNAVTTLARYFIVILGMVMAFSAIGIGWSKVQWLIAAVSVGLGFGLQEIFANFVSGLILLFERPIRVGDLVSVGNVVGRVSRIRIRATTIQDWDRKELVVPNREFVTGHFVNWTLTDSVVRWIIPVGVAYGSDTQRALDLLMRAAAESEFVLKEPRPEAVFVKFGDSALELNLRVFVDMSTIDFRWMTQLHQAIDRLFREAGIEIAFPQRDVNLKVSGPLLEALQRGAGSDAATAR